LVEQNRVPEWSREIDGWATMPKGAVIEDRCLVRPIPVKALLDATSADEAVPRALRRRAIACRELGLLDRWLVRAATCSSPNELGD
jgi:hypothetical protein